MDTAPGKLAENLETVVNGIAGAAQERADLVAFPEAALCDYYIEDFAAFAAPIPGEQTEAVGAAAREHGVWVSIGLVERVPEGLYNTAVLISPRGEVVGKYRKTHLSVVTRNGTIPRESDAFLAGEALEVFETPLAKIGMMICKDGDYPEVSRTLAVKGAEIIIWLTCRGGVPRHYCEHYAQVNAVTLAACNRAQGHAAGGGSAIYDFRGNLLAAAEPAPCTITARIDLQEMRRQRPAHWTHGRLRRPRLYEALTTELGPFSLTEMPPEPEG